MPSLGSVLISTVSALKGLKVDIDLVPTTFGYPVLVKYGGPDQMAFSTPTPTPTPLPGMMPVHFTAFNQFLSGMLPSWTDQLAPRLSIYSVHDSPISGYTHSPITHQWSHGFPAIMNTNLFSPAGFMSLIGVIIAITLPLWAICGLTFKGSIWFIKNKYKK